MKIATNAPELEMGNVGATGQFTIKASVHSFRILSSGLYSNKIKAIVRELSCNAVDSHVAAGKADVPFAVHLPNAIEPFFSVRDFGTGLSAEDVMTVYTRYFESTKQGSNDYIGALGLGSKSPFSYTDNFTVAAIQNGVKRIYTAYIDATGCPAIAEFGSCDTNEPNGVEVKFSVTDRNDIYRFVEESREVFKWFKLKPDVTGNTDYREKLPEIKTADISPGVHLANMHRPVAVQGNIAYPISLPKSEEYEHLESLMRCPLIIEFNIGDVEIAASREELSYTDATVKAIVARYETIRDDIAEFVNNEILPITCEWEKALKIMNFSREEIFAAATRKLVDDGVSKLLTRDPTSYRSNIIYSDALKLERFEYKRKGLDIRVFKVDTWRKAAVREIMPYDSYNNNDAGEPIPYSHHTVPLTPNSLVFVTNDNEKKLMARVRNHYRDHGKHDQVIIMLTTAKECKDSEALYKEVIDHLCNPPVPVVKASDFAVEPRKINNKHDILTCKARGHHDRNGTPYVMVQKDFTEDPAKEYWYVPLSNYTVLTKNGTENYDFLGSTMRNLTASGILSARNIYGVRKGAMEEIKKRKNWKCAYTEIAKILNAYDVKELYVPIYKGIVSRDIVNETVVKYIEALDADSTYRKFCEETAAIMGNFHSNKDAQAIAYKELMQVFDVKHTATDISKDVKARYEALFDKYPMLKFLEGTGHGSNLSSRTAVDRLLGYIKLIDNNTRGNTNE